jgi:hypothetical protein
VFRFHHHCYHICYHCCYHCHCSLQPFNMRTCLPVVDCVTKLHMQCLTVLLHMWAIPSLKLGAEVGVPIWGVKESNTFLRPEICIWILEKRFSAFCREHLTLVSTRIELKLSLQYRISKSLLRQMVGLLGRRSICHKVFAVMG